ncbi:MAG: radical SAM protein [Syntrophaceae bacterium]|nr:radical SAM protein [Syntrophaceae bacterium]
MRVLLISPNIEMLPDPVAPLGLAFLSSALKSCGQEVCCLDLCFEEDVEQALESAISRFAPQAIGLSLRNIDNVAYPESVSYLPFFKKVIERCRRFSSSPIFLGGSGFTLMPERILSFLEADGGIAGEGEEAFPKVLSGMLDSSFPRIEGFISRESKELSGPSWVQNLDSLSSPDWTCMDLKAYFAKGGMGNLQTKRGCPFSCIYCTYPLIEGTAVRLRSPRRVADEAEALLHQGVRNIFIVDNIFNFPESHARAVCEAFIERGLSLQWSCYANPAFFSRSLAKVMKQAGCTGVEFGTDSGSPPVLARLGKNFTPEDIRRGSLYAREAGLEVCHSLSLGAPGDTDETLEETFRLMEEIAPTAVIAMVGLRIFPGTGLARQAEAEGLLSPDTDFLDPVFYIAPAVRDRLVDIVRHRSSLSPNWIFPGLSINVSLRLQSKLRKFGVKGPLWEHMKILRGRTISTGEPHA